MTEPESPQPGLILDPVTKCASAQGVVVELTATEFRLLEHLVRHVGKVFTRDELIRAVIGEEGAIQERTIDVHINALRRKLGDVHGIATVRGRGYRFR
jgi:two-component system phosphate regulon response regulator PhoB